jgi:Domain of unknown function (DUF6456)
MSGVVGKRMEDRDVERLVKGLSKQRFGPRSVDPAIVEELIARDVIRRDGQRLVWTAAGRARLRRSASAGNSFADQHRTLDTVVADLEALGPQAVTINADESPLARLHRVKGRGGKPLINDAERAAGERLRADFTRAQLMPRVTANWSAAIAAGRRDGGGMADLTDAVIAARQRIDRALVAVGPDFAGVLVDFCCFLKGIEEIETERSWPARSAKLVIRLALASLARHYGLSETARGPAGRGRMRHWGTEDYRPAIEPED